MNSCQTGAPMERLSAFGGQIICLILLIGATPASASTPQCTPAAFDDYVAISRIVDGDTVVFENGAKLRLIGLDTPEIGRDGKPDEVGAIAARDYLRGLLEPGQKYPVIYGIEKHDHYGRLLGHLFLPDGTNIQARLLAEGMATPFTVPPNLQLLDCYRESSAQAITGAKGLWGLKQYQPIPVQELTGNKRHYRVVEGYVTRTGNSRSSIWINMGTRLAIRIAREDLKYFNGLELTGLSGKYVRVRGMLYQHKGELRMRLRHRVDLQQLTPPREAE